MHPSGIFVLAYAPHIKAASTCSKLQVICDVPNRLSNPMVPLQALTFVILLPMSLPHRPFCLSQISIVAKVVLNAGLLGLVEIVIFRRQRILQGLHVSRSMKLRPRLTANNATAGLEHEEQSI